MAKDSTSIPILGVDKRLLERQAVPGLCEQITGLRPDGPAEDPYWRAVPNPDQLKNSGGTPFTHTDSDKIIAAYWQKRSVVGGYAEEPDDTRLNRLLVFLSTGDIDIVDPDYGSGWEVVKTYTVENDPTAEWEVDFTTIGEVVAIAVRKDEQPMPLIYLFDDLFIPNGYPPLPHILVHPLIDDVSQVEFDAEDYEGFRTGYFALRFAYTLSNGDAVMMSRPLIIDTFNMPVLYQDEKVRWKLILYLGGFVNTPDNLEFWKDVLTGINVYMAFTPAAETLFGWPDTDLPLFYEVARFDTIDVNDILAPGFEFPDPLEIYFLEDDLISYPVAPVDDFTNHVISASNVISYNKRLILGDTSRELAKPPIDPVLVSENVVYLITTNKVTLLLCNGLEVDNGNGEGTPDDVSVMGTNISGITKTFEQINYDSTTLGNITRSNSYRVIIEFTPDEANYDITIEIHPTEEGTDNKVGAKSTITLDQDDF